MARNRDDAPTAVKDAPALDLFALASSVETVRITSSNPFVPVLRESYDAWDRGENGWRGNTVPGYHVRRFAGTLRNATQALADEGIGVRIRYAFTDDNGAEVEKGDVKIVPEDERAVTVKYLARPRKDYSAANGETDADGTDVDDNDE